MNAAVSPIARLIAITLFYLPLAVVVIVLSRRIPLEGGLYRWAQQGFGDFLGFMTAWNLVVYAIINAPSILYVMPTDLAYLIGPSASWLPDSRAATGSIIFGPAIFISLIAVRELAAAKWLHNAGSVLICAAYGGSDWSGSLARFGIFYLLVRAVAGTTLIFTGLTRWPVTAGWDRLLVNSRQAVRNNSDHRQCPPFRRLLLVAVERAGRGTDWFNAAAHIAARLRLTTKPVVRSDPDL